jgi:lipopolysaccharide transport system permease protein
LSFNLDSSDSLVSTVREISKHRELLYMITWREIKLKYKQSIMGVLWAVLMPLIVVSAGLLVRFALATVSGTALSMSEVVSISIKATPWAFFVSALRFGTSSLVANTNLVTKIYLPRLVFPTAAVCSQLFDFMVAGVIVGILMVIAQTGVSIHLLWLPILVGFLIILAAALAMICSAASLFFRDVKYMVEVFLTFAIFFTPVFYDSSMFGRWAPLVLLNPVSPLLEGISTTAILHKNPSLPWLLYSVLSSSALFIVALKLFRKLEPLFAESV